MAKNPNRKKSAAPADETKAQKFVRLGSARVAKALKAIDQLGNLAGAGYERTDAQIAKIFAALDEHRNAALERFQSSGKAAVAKFEL